MWLTPWDQRLIPGRPPERDPEASFSDRAAAGSRGGAGSGGCAVVALPHGAASGRWKRHRWRDDLGVIFTSHGYLGVYGIPNKRQ